ncbi:MAG: tRNA 5-methoxyuridine(34)/uridine 5-oxyacetic acid(34) synthase CmoB [Gammaproteobacteria bacterium]|jgi:tRNA (mo5U34)-methyltransferase|nr:tRNA 5-methoxyuridine(34)/uridine 5-oxyacetic acid(34) synthase CmoB [Gammaproteobacteria bacterium]
MHSLQTIFDYSGLKEKVKGTKLARLADAVPEKFLAQINHGDFPAWKQMLDSLPVLTPSSYELDKELRIGQTGQLNNADLDKLKKLLMGLQPWRKGPFNLFGLEIDTEWRSDWKWDRLKTKIASLTDRKVLDVGCGNGYHTWRMEGAGARIVIGVDPHLLFNMQYWAIRHFLAEPPVYVLPLALEEIPEKLEIFDTVFSMGVLYHRRSPIDHLYALKDCLRKGGELVLETLVIDGEIGVSLLPEGRYARMPNVWFLPTCATLESWLIKVGYKNVKLVDVSVTSIDEQRSTEWMNFESLPQALDENDPSITIEGLPAPKRAIFIAEK